MRRPSWLPHRPPWPVTALIAGGAMLLGVTIANIARVETVTEQRDDAALSVLELARLAEGVCAIPPVSPAPGEAEALARLCHRAQQAQRSPVVVQHRGEAGRQGLPGRSIPGPPGRPGRDAPAVPGPPGPQGPQGRAGESVQGPTGPQGEPGEPGRDGEPGRPPAGFGFTHDGQAYRCGPSTPPDPGATPQYTCTTVPPPEPVP